MEVINSIYNTGLRIQNNGNQVFVCKDSVYCCLGNSCSISDSRSCLYIKRGPILCPLVTSGLRHFRVEAFNDTGHGISTISQHSWLHIFGSKNWSVHDRNTFVHLCIYQYVYLSAYHVTVLKTFKKSS